VNRYSGPGSRRAWGANRTAWLRGTNRSATLNDWLPVPRRPLTCHTSCNVALLFGSSRSRCAGRSSSSVLGDPSRAWSWHTASSQLACPIPLANIQRPVTRYPPSHSTAQPGRLPSPGPLARIVRAPGPNSERAVAGSA
jgi:hypothetical protein